MSLRPFVGVTYAGLGNEQEDEGTQTGSVNAQPVAYHIGTPCMAQPVNLSNRSECGRRTSCAGCTCTCTEA